MPAPSVLMRLNAGDRALFHKLLLPSASHVRLRAATVALTHLGGATGSIVAAAVLWLDPDQRALGRHALVTLVLSHLAVQLLKRTIGRPRPSRGADVAALIAEPDHFSFPSGHACAALAVALAYAVAFPSFGVVIIALATIVGATRVLLGVHYPGDVAAGQCVALLTHLVLARGGL